MKSLIIKRSLFLDGRKTSVSVEDNFWEALKEIAARREMTLSGLISEINAQRQHGNLSSAIRLFVLEHYRERSAAKAGSEIHRITAVQGGRSHREPPLPGRSVR
jgi:predicted DNA-binding ribbon-helix-helix protein